MAPGRFALPRLVARASSHLNAAQLTCSSVRYFKFSANFSVCFTRAADWSRIRAATLYLAEHYFVFVTVSLTPPFKCSRLPFDGSVSRSMVTQKIGIASAFSLPFSDTADPPNECFNDRIQAGHDVL
jgi:hypothetical protein